MDWMAGGRSDVIHDKWICNDHFFPAGEVSGPKMIGVIIFFETAHKNSKTGRRRVQALMVSDVRSKSWNVAERRGMSSKGSDDGKVKIVVLTNGGTMRILLHRSFVGFVSGTVRAFRESKESAPLRDHFFLRENDAWS
jgi:hypothetical protein